MAGVGGYQAPAKPAGASGPGKYSQRTDHAPKFSMPGLPYGDGAELATQEAGAPMARTATPPRKGSPPAEPDPGIIGLDAASLRPDEPVTAGSPLGPGPGPEVLPGGAQTPSGELSNMIYTLAASDRTGALAALGMEAMRRGL